MKIRLESLLVPIFALALLAGTSCREKIKGDSSTYVKMAMSAALKRGDWRKAAELAATAVKRDRENANAHLVYALALEQAGQHEKALNEALRAAQLDPEHFMAQYTKGRMLFERHQYQDCIGPLAAADKLKPGCPQVLILMGKCHSVLNNLNQARKCYTRLGHIPEYRKRPEAFNELGVLYLKKGEVRKGFAYIYRANQLKSSDPVLVLNLAIVYDVYLNQPRKAVLLYNKYLKLILRNNALEPKRDKVRMRIDKIRNQ